VWCVVRSSDRHVIASALAMEKIQPFGAVLSKTRSYELRISAPFGRLQETLQSMGRDARRPPKPRTLVPTLTTDEGPLISVSLITANGCQPSSSTFPTLSRVAGAGVGGVLSDPFVFHHSGQFNKHRPDRT